MTDRKVTKEEFVAHLQAWPRRLVRDVARIFEPPVVSYNDFTYGKWPDSVVAYYRTEIWLDDKGKTVPPYDDDWTIKKELPET